MYCLVRSSGVSYAQEKFEKHHLRKILSPSSGVILSFSHTIILIALLMSDVERVSPPSNSPTLAGHPIVLTLYQEIASNPTGRGSVLQDYPSLQVLIASPGGHLCF